MRVPKFHAFYSEKLQGKDNNVRAPPAPQLPSSPVGLIAVSGHNFPLFEMLELERAWLFRTHFRLNSKLRRMAESVIAQYTMRRSCLIAVHVRRTDYKNLLGKNLIKTYLWQSLLFSD